MCYIQIGLAEGYSLAYASLYEVQNADNAIISKCGTGDGLRGGNATNIGQYDQVHLTTALLGLGTDGTQELTADLPWS